MYSLEFTHKAEKQFIRLEREIQQRIAAALERTKARPHVYFGRLVGEKLYRLRVGDYRVLADIEEGRLVILVIEVGHRKNIYDRLRL